MIKYCGCQYICAFKLVGDKEFLISKHKCLKAKHNIFVEVVWNFAEENTVLTIVFFSVENYDFTCIVLAFINFSDNILFFSYFTFLCFILLMFIIICCLCWYLNKIHMLILLPGQDIIKMI